MRSDPPTGDELARLLESMKAQVLERTADEPAPASRGPIAKRVTGIVLGIAALLGIGAGAAFAFGVLPGGEPAPSAPPRATAVAAPSPTTSVPPVEYEVTPGPPPGPVQPASAYPIGCADLAPRELVAGLFAEPVEAVDPLVEASGVGISIPRTTWVLDLGGLDCTWSNGVAYNDQYGDVPDYRGVSVTVVPQPDGGWSELAALRSQPRLFTSCSTDYCSATTETEGSWIEFQGVRIDAAGWPGFVDTVTAAISEAAAPSTPPQGYAGTLFDCSAFPSVDAIAAATGAEGVVEGDVSGGGGGGWSAWAEAWYHSGDLSCQWSTSDRSLASAARVTDGRWAYERMLLAGRSEPVSIAGLAAGDEATLRCDDRFGNACAVDLAIGDDWLNVYGRDRATAIAVAEAVVAHRAG
ncbi:hypothetical protein ROT00_12995 [Agromyces mediolanus]|uniref:hypothetical protein n=1 Tax=Agromyces mediolanus TaxID=41986 RepID=UPI003834FFEC